MLGILETKLGVEVFRLIEETLAKETHQKAVHTTAKHLLTTIDEELEVGWLFKESIKLSPDKDDFIIIFERRQ